MPPRAVTLLASLAALIGSADPAIAQADKWPGEIEHHFRLLRELIRKEDGPTEIYGLLSNGSQCVIEVKDGAGFLHCDDGNGRTRERQVRSDELTKLKQWLRANKVDELPPYNEGAFDGNQYEYIHLDRSGTERRVPMNNPPGFMGAPAVVLGSSTPAPKRQLYGALTKRMSDLASAPMRVRYKSIEQLPGFELIHTYEHGDAERLSFRKGKLFASIRTEYPKRWHEVTRGGIAARGVVEPRNPLDNAFDPSSSSNYADATEGPYAGKRLWAGSREKDNFEGLLGLPALRVNRN